MDESIGTRGVLVLCHSIYVLKWMNRIKAQSLLGGCLCDILTNLIRLPSHHYWNDKSTHTHAERCKNAMSALCKCEYTYRHSGSVFVIGSGKL